MYLYWHVPLWQALLVATMGFVLFGWLLVRVWRGSSVGDALHRHAPALNHEICFYYSPEKGLQALSDAAAKMNRETDGALDDRFWDAVMETATEGRHVTVRDWPQTDMLLITLPVQDEMGKDWHVLALAMPETAAPTPAAAPIVEEASPDDAMWIPIRADVAMHRTLPLVRVRRPGQEEEQGEGPPAWEIRDLSVTEHQLLQFLYAHAGEVQSAEALFSALWPTEPVSAFGLRPEQRDRVRRVIFQLRRKIEPIPQSPQIIRTTRGVGYALYLSEEMDH